MLRVRTGIDLVAIERFAGSLQRGGEAFRRRLFHPPEAQGASTERLAAIFAAKGGGIQGAGAAGWQLAGA